MSLSPIHSSRSTRTFGQRSLFETVLHSAAVSLVGSAEDSDGTISEDDEEEELPRRENYPSSSSSSSSRRTTTTTTTTNCTNTSSRLPPQVSSNTKKNVKKSKTATTPNPNDVMSRIDRMKQKAMRSANRELGIMEDMGKSSEIDVSFLASVLGISPTTFIDEGSNHNNNTRSKSATSRSSTPNSSSKTKNKTKKSKSSSRKEFGSSNHSKEDNTSPPPVVGAQAGSLASALGMSIDMSSQAPPIRKIGESSASSSSRQARPSSNNNGPQLFAPQPGSLAEALLMSVRPTGPPISRGPPQHHAPPAETKAAAPIQAQPGSLAAALGFSVNPATTPTTTAKEQTTQTPTKAQPGSLAAALGMSVHPAGSTRDSSQQQQQQRQNKSTVSQAQPGSLAAALGMSVKPSTQPVEHAPSQAQPGSLAAALGMSVKPSTQPVVEAAPRQAQPGSLAAALGMSVRPSSQSVEHAAPSSRAQPGSLAAALGMSVQPSTRPVVEAAPRQAQPGSLAAALGMSVQPSSQPVQHVAPPPPSQAQPGSLAAALGMSVRPSSQPVEQAPRQAQPGSLAAALGMSVRPSTGSQYVVEAAPRQAQPGSLAAALGMSVRPSSQPAVQQPAVSKAQPGSLAAALGMSIDHSRESQTSNTPQHHQIDQPRTGSLAAALGMHVNTSRNAAPIQLSPPTAPTRPNAGSLAAALGMSVDPSWNASPVRQTSSSSAETTRHGNTTSSTRQENLSRGAPGSLAAALGLYVDPSPRSPPIREKGEGSGAPSYLQPRTVVHSTSQLQQQQQQQQPMPGSLAAALGARVDFSHPAALAKEQEEKVAVAAAAKAGSLAAALGIKVDRSRNAAPIRENGKAAPRVQPHNGTTFVGPSSAQAGSLAAALGMVVDPSTSAPPIRAAGQTAPPSMMMMPKYGSKRMSLTDAVMSKFMNMDDDDESDHSYSSHDDEDDSESTVVARNGSLAAALGMKIDISGNAAPIREHGRSAPPTQPIPKTTAVVRLLEKQFSTSQARALAEAMSMMIDSSSTMATLSLPSSVQHKIETTLRGHFSLAQVDSLVTAMGMLTSSNSPEVISASNSDSHSRGMAEAKSGSLAAALGIKVDASPNAAAVREVGRAAPPLQPSPPPARKSLADMVLTRVHMDDSDSDSSGSDSDSSSDDESLGEEEHIATPQFGSLASALGVQVKVVPKKTTERTRSSVAQEHVRAPQHGSLAAALGMMVDPSATAAPVQQKAKMSPSTPPHHHSTSSSLRTPTLVDLVMKRVGVVESDSDSEDSHSSGSEDSYSDDSSDGSSDSSDDESVNDEEVAAALPRSLAVSLGMPVPPVRETPRKSLMDMVMGKVSIDDGYDSYSESSDDESDDESVDNRQLAAAQTGSLAAALGMKVDATPNAAPIREMPVLPAASSTPRRTSLADLVLARVYNAGVDDNESVDSYSDSSDDESTVGDMVEAAQQGSLAAALGMSVDSSHKAAPIRTKQQYLNTNGGSTLQSQDRFDAEDGSTRTLEDALGTPIERDVVSSVIKQTRSMSKSKKSLFDAAINRMGLPGIDEPVEDTRVQDTRSAEDFDDGASAQFSINTKGKQQYKSRLERMQAKAQRAAAREGNASLEPKNPAEKRAEILENTPPTIVHDNSVGGDSARGLNMPEDDDAKEQMARLERIKAKALKAANKDLGMDPSEFADALGIAPSTGRDSVQDTDETTPRLDVNEEDIADALGIPKSLFSSTSQAQKNEVHEEDAQNDVPTSKKDRSTKEKTKEPKPIYKSRLERMQAKLFKASKRDLLHAEGEGDNEKATEMPMAASSGNEAEAAEPASTPKMSRLDRMKAKAIKAANRDLGIDAGELADALGMGSKSSVRRSSSTGSVAGLSQARSAGHASAEGSSGSTGLGLDLDDVAAALGMPASMFALAQTSAQEAQMNEFDEMTKDQDPAEMFSLDAVMKMREETGNDIAPTNRDLSATLSQKKPMQRAYASMSSLHTQDAAPVDGAQPEDMRSPGAAASTGLMREASLRAALVESQAKAAGVDAYNKRLEEQLFERANLFSDKLSMLEDKIAKYQEQINEKSWQIKSLEANIATEKKEKQSLSFQWSQTGTKLEEAVEKVVQSRALLQQEYAEVKEMKNALQEQHAIVSKRLEDLQALEHRRSSVLERMTSFEQFNDPSSSPESTSHVLRNIQESLRSEGERRKSLTARLKSKDKAASTTNTPQKQTSVTPRSSRSLPASATKNLPISKSPTESDGADAADRALEEALGIVESPEKEATPKSASTPRTSSFEDFTENAARTLAEALGFGTPRKRGETEDTQETSVLEDSHEVEQTVRWQ